MRNATAAHTQPELSPAGFRRFSQLAYTRFGLSLDDSKIAMVSVRLARKLRELGLSSFDDYYRLVLEDRDSELTGGLIDALTTHFTGFLREEEHFDILCEIGAQYQSRAVFPIWSAACSTGEEPYSILFSLLEKWPRSSIRMLATDISERVLDTARNGIYDNASLVPLPPHWTHSYFLRGHNRWHGSCRVKPEYRTRVDFRRFNLIDSVLPETTFPVIFCRNVMIYFDRTVQRQVVERLVQCIEPGGYLFIGHAENISGLNAELTLIAPAVYRRSGYAV